MQTRALRSVAFLVGVLIFSAPLLAHHGNAAFDDSKRVTVKATVTEWFWANPHCFLKFDAKDESGNLVHWVAETGNPPDMINRGWSRQSFKTGDEVTVTMTTVRFGQPIGRIQQVVLASGRTLGNVAPRPADSAPRQ